MTCMDQSEARDHHVSGAGGDMWGTRRGIERENRSYNSGYWGDGDKLLAFSEPPPMILRQTNKNGFSKQFEFFDLHHFSTLSTGFEEFLAPTRSPRRQDVVRVSVCDFMLSNTLKKFCSILMSPGGVPGQACKHVSNEEVRTSRWTSRWASGRTTGGIWGSTSWRLKLSDGPRKS